MYQRRLKNFPLSCQRIAISPDGDKIAYIATDDDIPRIYLHKIGELVSTPLSGTENAYYPFFSPDGRWIGFCSGSSLKKILIGSSVPITICEVGIDFAGATWGEDDFVIYGTYGGGLMQVSSLGGESKSITTPEGATSHRWPKLMAGGKKLLFTI